MQYNDILDRLQKYTNQKISQAEMAEALEISQSAISKRITRDSDFGLRDLFKAMNYFQNKYNLGNYQSEINNKNNNINDEITEETVSVDYYPEVFGSCGDGKFVLIFETS